MRLGFLVKSTKYCIKKLRVSAKSINFATKTNNTILNMEIRGRITQVLQLQQGVAQASGKAWKKQEYVLQTYDQYPRTVCFNLFGERVDQYANLLQVGADVNVSFDIESREYNGRWYTDVRAWKVEDGAQAAANAAAAMGAPAGGFQQAQPFQVGFAQPGQPAPATSVPQFQEQPAGAPNPTDDLPF